MTTRVVRTERLLLRAIGVDDAEAMAAIYADPEVARFVHGLDLEGTRAQLTRWSEEWESRGLGTFAVLDGASGEFLGRAGVKYWQEFDFTEVGWVLRRDVWGRGYATEAGRASLDYAFANSDLDLVTAIIAHGNDASVVVARRLGMEPWREQVMFGMSCTIYAARRPVG
ncbi:MAG TPA: GNAT family N-acetyltransferase [Mycobacteriales bacterium]|jgi:RimJ/RimL family protein N-acetyltransferase|nr:GNAT family N-acetyltransferase [Mycobacteriales bacterium]